ncbi:hypothetical protein PV326_006491, partial [Microctonus aethiopoides]
MAHFSVIEIIDIDYNLSLKELKCEKIQKAGYDKLKGIWYFIGEVSKDLPLIRCGYINVNKTTETGFHALLTITKHTGAQYESFMRGSTYNNDSVEVWSSDSPTSIYHISICEENSLFYLERKKNDEMRLFSRNKSISSDISGYFEARESQGALYEYANIEC